MGELGPTAPRGGFLRERRLEFGVLAGAFAVALLLLRMGLETEKPVLLPLLALAAPAGAALLFLDAFTLLAAGLAILPWAIFINIGEGLPVISFYFFSVLAAAKTLMRPGPKEISPTFLALALYGVFLLASVLLLGSLEATKSKLFHWFNFVIFYFALYNNAGDLARARRLLTVLTAASLANAVFSVSLYYVANFAFPTPPTFVESVLFPVGRILYGSRGFDLIINGTNWFTESGTLKAIGLFHNPTQSSLYALMSFSLSAFLLLDRRGLVPRGLLFANVTGSLAHLILSSGRSGMVITPLVLGVWLLALARITGFRMAARNVAMIGVVAALLGTALGNVLVMNFNSLISLDYYSNAGRLVAMTSGLTVASHAGPFGYGFGVTPAVIEIGHATSELQQGVNNLIGAVSYSFKSILADEYYRQTNYHSWFLDLLVQTGFVGFLLFFLIFFRLSLPPAGSFPALRFGCFAIVWAFIASQGVGADVFYPKVMVPLLAIAALAEKMNSKGFGMAVSTGTP